MDDDYSVASGENSATADVDRIRDILFGSKIQDFERRMQEVEQSHRQELDKLRQALSARLDGLEEFTRQELERLAQKQAAEHRERATALETLQTGLGQLENRLRADLDDVDVRGDQDRRAIREELLQHGQGLRDEQQALQREMRAHTDQAVTRLQQEKTGKEELSRLLQEFALRLSGEFQLPDE